MTATLLLIICLLLLLEAGLISAFAKGLKNLGPIQGEKEFKAKRPLYGVTFLVKRFFPQDPWHAFLFLLHSTEQILRLLYAVASYLVFSSLFTLSFPWAFVYYLLAFVIASLLLDTCIFFLSHLAPRPFLRLASLLTALFFLLLSPLTFLVLAVQRNISQHQKLRNQRQTSPHLKDKILEFIQESRSNALLDVLDRRLILSVALFRDRIAREIMVPRIDVFALSADQPLKEAARAVIEEGFSRVPVYQDKIDHIIGVLLYKDVIEYYHDSVNEQDGSRLATPVHSLVKPILYCPETKKISSLLQEFRQKQTHLAIVVDEYGGTEGIVTIEDILEELVGEIADEHDIEEEEKLYAPFAKGGWIVDAKMTIVDVEKELGISIPKSAEYDTIGGFVFHRAGTIPSKGWKFHSDAFDIEVLSSSNRSIEKVMITPAPSLD